MSNIALEIPTCLEEDWRLITRGEYAIPLRDSPKTILDIGANVGIFSAWAAARWPAAHISAYEPWPSNVKMLRKNTKAFPLVTVKPCAVFDQTGPRKMFDNGYSPLHSLVPSLNHNYRRTGRTRTVDCVDAGELGSAEFVKIDAEGAELPILKRLDLSETKALAVEAHTEEDDAAIVALMTEAGFAVYNRTDSGAGCKVIKFARRTELSTTPKLFLAIPTYGAASTQFWKCVMKLQSDRPCNLAMRLLDGDSLVTRARNTLTADFLRSDCTDMLMLDSDIVFTPNQVARLMSHKVDLVAGFYPKKQEGPLRWVCNAIKSKPRTDGLQRVRYMGTGFMRIGRSVFERMIERYGEQIAYHPDSDPKATEYDFWSVGVYRNPKTGFQRYLSEDWFFCQRWLDLGGTVWGDTRIILRHISGHGDVAWPLRTQEPEIEHPQLEEKGSDHA
jgi:FkbM family methyltransferase